MSKKILTVDDSKPIRMIIQRAFRNHDCQIVEAGDGVEGLVVAARERPDLIILDLTMPVMDGFEMLTRLKSSPDLKTIPVLMLTAEAGKDNVLRIAKMGVRGYIVKPFKDEAIIEKVAGIIPLELKGNGAAGKDQEIRLLVVEDKAPVVEQLRKALADTSWKIESTASKEEALARCDRTTPSAIVASLSLPNEGAFALLQELRGKPALKAVPLLGICLVSAAADQDRARLLGVSNFVNKPINAEAVKSILARALNIDTTAKHFEEANGRLVIRLPAQLDAPTGNRIALSARSKIPEAVENGASALVIDMRPVAQPDLCMIEMVISIIETCKELSLEHLFIGTEATKAECGKFEESQDWQIHADPNLISA